MLIPEEELALMEAADEHGQVSVDVCLCSSYTEGGAEGVRSVSAHGKGIPQRGLQFTEF